MNSVPILNIKSVTTGYDKGIVLDDVSLSVDQGKIYGLIGLNGAGKTTLIKSILGLHTCGEGDINVLGRPVPDLSVKKDIAYLPERFEPPWFLSGLEFIKFSLSLYGKTLELDRVLRAADSLALERDVLQKRVQTYSKGMRQKLGLLSSVITECKFVILDEPMSGLDPRARRLVKDALLDMKSDKTAIFFSSHVLADMDEICDEVAVLHDAKIQYSGTPHALKKKTKSKSLERSFLSIIDKAE